MHNLTTPIAAWAHDDDVTKPLIVLLHGRGSNEQEILSLATSLPPKFSVVALRAPLAEGGGFAWFANRGIGRPIAESLAETLAWGRRWLDDIAPPPRPVILIGFSGGAAYGGGLLLADPSRYSGTAVLYGTLPFDAGVPTTPGHLHDTPVLIVQGRDDQVIPPELLARTREYVANSSGAIPHVSVIPGAHGISAEGLTILVDWLNGLDLG
jgi:phospholipase/carboxylesterase